MKKSIAILLVMMALSPSANAGWWSKFCERHLVADDPTQYQSVPTEYLLAAYKRTAVEVVIYQNVERQRRRSAKRLTLIGDELRSRPLTPYAQFITRAYTHLEYYGKDIN